MTTITQSISEMVGSIHVKDVLSFSLNSEYLHHNFNILKQCLLKLQEMEGSIGQEKNNLSALTHRLTAVQKGLEGSQKDHLENGQKIKQLQNNIGDDFMKKMYSIEEKTKNMYSFEDTVRKLEGLEKFMTVSSYKDNESKMMAEIDQVKKIKNQLQRYVPNAVFTEFKQTQDFLHNLQSQKHEDLLAGIRRIDSDIQLLSEKLQLTQKDTAENAGMIKEINFPQLMDKNKRFKEDMDQKMNDLIIKMKKKVGTSELHALEQTMIDKLDKFLSENQKNKAEKNETKDALIFLSNKISEIEDYMTEKATEDEKDGLFTTKKVHCASCTKDLGKYQGKLGQYRPWSIFPCKELDPEKTGGFGYMSYLDKVQIKKGSVDDQAFERLNRTAVEKDRENSPKRGSSTARASNIISNFGSEQKGGISLKDVYFREQRTEKGDRANAKFFRVKKQSAKMAVDLEKPKQI